MKRITRVALLALAVAGTARADVFTFEPAAPIAGQFVRVTARHDQGCPVLDHLVERFDQGVGFTFFEPCECPPGLYGPVEASAVLAPVHAGEVRATVRVQRVAGDVFCGPAILVADEAVTVTPSPDYAVAISPPLPTTAADVVVTIDSSCPIDWGEPTRDGFNIYFFAVPSPVGAPCTSSPTYRHQVSLGSLSPGQYTVILLSEHVDAPAHLHQRRFTVIEHAIPELLLAGDVSVTTTWKTKTGAAGVGTAKPLTLESGAFWFFSPGNLEVTVKVLDGCGLNGHRWLLAAGMTNVEAELTARDLQSGAVRTYTNPLGRPFAPILDTRAFVCP